MNFTRIASVIDVDRLQRSHATVVGSAPMFTANLFRCGLGAATLIDPQNVELPNISRQDYPSTAIGFAKVHALADQIRSINPEARVTCLQDDFCAFDDAEMDELFAHTNLFVAATDFFPAQALVSEVATRLGIPAIFIGLYAGALGGEIAWWKPDIDSCFRCLMSKRYEAHAQAAKEGRSLDPVSDGADIFSIQLLDAIAGQVALGLLTPASHGRFSRLVDQLGTGAQSRNLLQIKIDPGFTFSGRDIFREQLQIPESCDAYFAWNTIVRRDNPFVRSGCRDCTLYRGHYWTPLGCTAPSIRVKPGDPDYDEAEARRQRAHYAATDRFSLPV
jgi:molybdopterin/thiamine biosynthesis adenylyltransferase